MAFLSFAAIGCGKKDEGSDKAKQAAPATAPADSPNTATAPADVVADAEGAKAIFDARCVACHGSGGHGDGVGAAALNPKPQDYTDSAWQASVSDEEIATAIVKGGLGVGKSAIMPANPDLKDKPAVVKGLVDMIRGFES